MALQRKTQGEMKAELRRRLGFASDGPSVEQNSLLLDDILQSSQEALFYEYDFPELRRVADITVQQGQRFFDYPADCEPRRIINVAVQINQLWIDLEKGIETHHDSYPNLTTYPLRYDTARMIELFPVPDTDYNIRVEYMANLMPFTQAHHVCTLDDRLVMAHAIAAAKAHYGHQDAVFYQRQLSELIRNMQYASHGGNSYSRLNSTRPAEPLPVRV